MTGSPGARSSGPIRVATYNLYLGADLGPVLGLQRPDEVGGHLEEVLRQVQATAFPRRVDALAALIVRERVDLLGLQEVCTWAADGTTLWDFAADLLAALEAAGEPYDVVVDQSTFRGTGQIPVEGRDPMVLYLAGSNAILRRRSSHVVVIATDSGIFDEALTMPALGDGEVSVTRGWCRAACLVGEQHLDFVNTHTEAHDQQSREVQRDELLAALARRAGPVVLVGDFNSPPHEVGMPPDLADAWLEAGNAADGTEAGTFGQAADLTNEQSTLHERIDYIWVRDLDVLACRRIGDHPDDRSREGLWPSDHAGVVAELALR